MKKNTTTLFWRNWVCVTIAGISILLGCQVPRPTERSIRHDLIGHTTGGRESSWQFQRGQIQSLVVDDRQGNNIFVSVVLHDDRTPYTYDAKLKLTYKHNRLVTVGLLSIAQR